MEKPTSTTITIILQPHPDHKGPCKSRPLNETLKESLEILRRNDIIVGNGKNRAIQISNLMALTRPLKDICKYTIEPTSPPNKEDYIEFMAHMLRVVEAADGKQSSKQLLVNSERLLTAIINEMHHSCESVHGFIDKYIDCILSLMLRETNLELMSKKLLLLSSAKNPKQADTNIKPNLIYNTLIKKINTISESNMPTDQGIEVLILLFISNNMHGYINKELTDKAYNLLLKKAEALDWHEKITFELVDTPLKRILSALKHPDTQHLDIDLIYHLMEFANKIWNNEKIPQKIRDNIEKTINKHEPEINKLLESRKKETTPTPRKRDSAESIFSTVPDYMLEVVGIILLFIVAISLRHDYAKSMYRNT